VAELNERVAKIEQRLDDRFKIDERRTKQIDTIDAKLDQLTIELARYRGVVGAILLISTALVTFLKLFGASVLAYFDK